ncbi:MAG: hypothetical protein ABH986_05725 [archaeon]
MNKEQFVEGKLEGCEKEFCSQSCCDDDKVEEWTNEYFAFHERMKEHLLSAGIKIHFAGDRVRFTNCSDGRECKFLKYSLNKDIDPRPIDCKIFPFTVDWESIDFNKKIAKLDYWDKSCPLVKSNNIPKEFLKEVEGIIKRDFAVLFYGARFEVKFPADLNKK